MKIFKFITIYLGVNTLERNFVETRRIKALFFFRLLRRYKVTKLTLTLA